MQLGLSESARATSAEESRFRINYPNSTPRKSRIIALDDASRQSLKSLAAGRPGSAHFLRFIESTGVTTALKMITVDAILEDMSGQRVRLSDEISDADVVVMVTSAGYSGDGAEVIGNACFVRNKMTTGLILSSIDASTLELAATLAAMRPFAAMLVISSGEEYVSEMLNALRV